MIITVQGTAASGKSTVAKELAKIFNYKHVSMGDLQREIAKEKGLTILELGVLEAKDDTIDRMIDDKQVKIGQTEDNVVIDGWLCGNFVPHAVKIFITGDPMVRAKRRLGHKREEEQFSDVSDALEDMQKREKVNQERWIRYYDYDYLDMDNYDLVIDTTELTIEEVVKNAVDFIKSKENIK